MKKILLFLLCMALLMMTGCAQKGQPLIPDDTASERWQRFASSAAFPGSYDVLSGSLRFGPADDTKRVTYTLWSEHDLPSGNPEDASKADRIIRIEIGASLAGSVGKMRIADGTMTLLLPKEGRIYVGSSSDDNLRKLLGLSLPLSVHKLNDFLAGRLFSALDEPRPERYETQEDGGFLYRYKTDKGTARIKLDAQALPVHLELGNGWELDITFDENGLPVKLSGRIDSTAGEQRLVMHVKGRRPASSVTPSSFGLTIPAGFTVYSLD